MQKNHLIIGVLLYITARLKNLKSKPIISYTSLVFWLQLPYFWVSIITGMENLHKILKIEKYKKIKFKVTKTQHLSIKAKINGISGNFILDTGASNTCIGFESIERFELAAKNLKQKPPVRAELEWQRKFRHTIICN